MEAVSTICAKRGINFALTFRQGHLPANGACCTAGVGKRGVSVARDARCQEMPKDDVPSLKYRDAGIPRYFVTSSTVDNFAENSENSKKDRDIDIHAAGCNTAEYKTIYRMYAIFNCHSVKNVADKRMRSFIQKYYASSSSLCKLFT